MHWRKAANSSTRGRSAWSDGLDEHLAATRDATRHRQLLIAGIGLALGAVFCWLITASITRPLRNALDVSGAIAGGRFDNAIVVKSA